MLADSVRSWRSLLGKLMVIVASGRGVWIRGLRCGVLAGVEHRSVLVQLNCRTVVDIGANRGQFALAARRRWPTARVISFEPLPKPAAVFRRVFKSDNLVVLHEAAIGPRDEFGTMHITRRDDSSSLLAISSLQGRIFPGRGEEVGTLRVRVAPLAVFVDDDQILEPALLKIDVQGYELEALRGCEPLLAKFERVYCECSFVELYKGQDLAGAVVGWLARRGYAMTGVFNATYDGYGRAIQADFLFERCLSEPWAVGP
jgi:FkbM family methyltransferase